MHQKHQNRTIKTTILQQYTSFVFPFAETRSVFVTSVDRENYQFTNVVISTLFTKTPYSLWELGLVVTVFVGFDQRSYSVVDPVSTELADHLDV